MFVESRKVWEALVLLLLFCAAGAAWDEKATHFALGETAVRLHREINAVGIFNKRNFITEDVNGDFLEFDAGEWIVKGVQDEDVLKPLIQRSARHFYNPVDNSGLLDFSSSLNWALLPTIPFGADNDFNLPSAREEYVAALTTTAPSARNSHFGAFYYRVGMLMHLVQDLTQAEHVRDDQHLTLLNLGTSKFVEGGFLEKYAAAQSVPGVLAKVKALGIPVDQPKTFPEFADFWEDRPSERADGNGTDCSGGVSEIVNCNFFSPDTIRPLGDEEYPHPRYPDDINENPVLPGELTYLSFTVPNKIPVQTVKGPYLTHKNFFLGPSPMKLARAGYYSFEIAKKIQVAAGVPPLNVIKAYDASWLISHDVIDDYITVQWPLAVRASAGVLEFFFPGWTITATATLSGPTVALTGSIRHNREPQTFRWNDVAANKTSMAYLLGDDIPDSIPVPLDVTDGVFERKIDWNALKTTAGLPDTALPEKVRLVFDIGAEHYEETVAVKPLPPAFLREVTVTSAKGQHYHGIWNVSPQGSSATLTVDRTLLSPPEVLTVTLKFSAPMDQTRRPEVSVKGKTIGTGEWIDSTTFRVAGPYAPAEQKTSYHGAAPMRVADAFDAVGRPFDGDASTPGTVDVTEDVAHVVYFDALAPGELGGGVLELHLKKVDGTDFPTAIYDSGVTNLRTVPWTREKAIRFDIKVEEAPDTFEAGVKGGAVIVEHENGTRKSVSFTGGGSFMLTENLEEGIMRFA
ncbi:MAG: hypothetical protein D6679_00005, partial [Candidatus Hydrogenedentota bacterium]